MSRSRVVFGRWFPFFRKFGTVFENQRCGSRTEVNTSSSSNMSFIHSWEGQSDVFSLRRVLIGQNHLKDPLNGKDHSKRSAERLFRFLSNRFEEGSLELIHLLSRTNHLQWNHRNKIKTKLSVSNDPTSPTSFSTLVIKKR